MLGTIQAVMDCPVQDEQVAVTGLTLKNFRNYPHLQLDVEPRPVVLTGDNGAGKTNLIEAVSMLAPGGGLRAAKLDEMDHDRTDPWHVQAMVKTGDGAIALETRRDPAKERRTVAINGKQHASSTALAEVTSILWLTPASDRLFVDPSSQRRRFLDRLVLAVTTSHGSQVRGFERAMRERARLLRDGKPDPAWLSVVEKRMAGAAVAVAAARLDLVSHLQGEIDRRLDPFDWPKLKVMGDVERLLEDLPALDAEEQIEVLLQHNRRHDAETGTTRLGTHRSDLLVFDHQTMEPAADCSTGRQKALLIAIILAEARLRQSRHGSLPILLLDEVTAHLDRNKRAALMHSLSSIGAQAWLTGTDPILFADTTPHYQMFEIQSGRLERR